MHDIICDEKGSPVSVLLLVKRRTAQHDGYSGPSFLESADGVDMETHAIVALGRYKGKLLVDKKMHYRDQFPLMLAWAVTVYAPRAFH